MTFKTNITNQGIAQLCLSHPPVNAPDSLGWKALSEEVCRISEDKNLKVLIVHAEGKGFCAGVDIAEVSNKIKEVNKCCYDTFKSIRSC